MEISDLSLSIFLTIPPINLLEGFDMTQLLKLTCKITLVFLSSIFLMSCKGGNVSSSFGSSGALVDQGPAGSSDGIAAPEFFYVGVDSEINDMAHVHQEGAFSKSCSIDPKSSLQDLRCIVDSPEAEIYMHGLALKYNVPQGMCRYLARETYWFYNHEIGYGPTQITVNITVTDGAVTASSCSFNGGATGACTSNIEALVDTSTSAPKIKCIYDHSDSQFGQNGCLGTYTYTLNTTTVNTTTGTTTLGNSVSVISWGGRTGPLIGGAARNGWTLSPDGIPARIYTPAHLGLFKQSYTVPAPINVSGPGPIVGKTAMEIANYATPALNHHVGYTHPATNSDVPYSVDPIDDFSGDLIAPGSDSYLFECVDQGHEILHRVKLFVREWNTYQDYYDYITSKGTTEVPDRVGNEPGSCNGIAGPCNDYGDFDDLVNFWVSYTTVVPLNNTTDPNLNRRRYYFPNLVPK